MRFLNIHAVAKLQKYERGAFRDFFHEEKVSQCRKKLKRGPFSLVRYCMLRGKKEKPFWFSCLGQQVQFGIVLKFCRIFGRTILVTSGVSKKKTLTKSHDHSRVFTKEKRRLKMNW